MTKGDPRPSELARRFIQEVGVPGSLRFWHGAFFVWQGHHYTEWKPADVKPTVRRFLLEAGLEATPHLANTVTDTVAALCHIEVDGRPPFWINQTDGPLPSRTLAG